MYRRVTEQAGKKAVGSLKGSKQISKPNVFSKAYDNIKHPKTEIGQMGKSILFGLGICSVAITASLLGLR
jgi:hypothetical protein